MGDGRRGCPETVGGSPTDSRGSTWTGRSNTYSGRPATTSRRRTSSGDSRRWDSTGNSRHGWRRVEVGRRSSTRTMTRETDPGSGLSSVTGTRRRSRTGREKSTTGRSSTVRYGWTRKCAGADRGPSGIQSTCRRPSRRPWNPLSPSARRPGHRTSSWSSSPSRSWSTLLVSAPEVWTERITEEPVVPRSGTGKTRSQESRRLVLSYGQDPVEGLGHPYL